MRNWSTPSKDLLRCQKKVTIITSDNHFKEFAQGMLAKKLSNEFIGWDNNLVSIVATYSHNKQWISANWITPSGSLRIPDHKVEELCIAFGGDLTENYGEGTIRHFSVAA